jgi:MraZ protein
MYGLEGITTHPVDGKGRVSLPANHRKALPDDLVVVRSQDKDFPSLWIYSAESYNAWVDTVFESYGGYQPNSKEHMQLRRILSGQKQKISVDQAGRILIKEDLREFASLGKTAVIMGVEDHVEVWDADVLAQNDEHYAEVSIFNLPGRLQG